MDRRTILRMWLHSAILGELIRPAAGFATPADFPENLNKMDITPIAAAVDKARVVLATHQTLMHATVQGDVVLLTARLDDQMEDLLGFMLVAFPASASAEDTERHVYEVFTQSPGIEGLDECHLQSMVDDVVPFAVFRELAYVHRVGEMSRLSLDKPNLSRFLDRYQSAIMAANLRKRQATVLGATHNA